MRLLKDLTALTAGTYTVTVTDAALCTAVLSANVTQPNALIISSTATPAAICFGASSTLNVSSTGGTGTVTYVWDNGLGSGSSHTVSPTATTIYTVTATDANGCTGSTQVTVTVNPLPTATASSNSPLCENGTLLLTSIGAGVGGTYSWSGPNGLTSTAQNPSIPNATINLNGTYTVTVTDGNGCTDTEETDVTVVPQPAIIITGMGN